MLITKFYNPSDKIDYFSSYGIKVESAIDWIWDVIFLNNFSFLLIKYFLKLSK